MTTEIEQAKREMYEALSTLRGRLPFPRDSYFIFDEALETYLEQLRQQYEEMASTAHQRFESIQSLEAANQDLLDQLAKMTESRDMFRNLHQAATHASIERAGQASTSGQDSGDRAFCAATGGKTAVLSAAIGLCRQQVELWALRDIKAGKAMRRIASVLNGDPDVANAMLGNASADGYGGWFINNDKCMHSFFAIGDDQMKCTFCGVGK